MIHDKIAISFGLLMGAVLASPTNADAATWSEYLMNGAGGPGSMTWSAYCAKAPCGTSTIDVPVPNVAGSTNGGTTGNIQSINVLSGDTIVVRAGQAMSPTSINWDTASTFTGPLTGTNKPFNTKNAWTAGVSTNWNFVRVSITANSTTASSSITGISVGGT
jgi:hypothetical protein